MLPDLLKIKGVHPGAVLKRELKNRNIRGSHLAQKIGEHKQTISALVHQRRGMNPELSIKLGREFGVEHDYFMLLQASYEVKRAQEELRARKPDFSKFRKVLFWDTNMETIDWENQKPAVIQRVLERGNDQEIQAIIDFYGLKVIRKELNAIAGSRLESFQENVRKYKLA